MKKGSLRAKKRKITFILEMPEAKEVHLVGEFNDWKSGIHPMKNNGNGVWAKAIMLPEGKYEYKFLVDNQWMADPQNERVCANCFGTTNSIVRVIQR